MKNLTDRVAVVTGAGSGIGHALAVAFAGQGMKLTITDINRAGLEETAALVRESNGRCQSIVTDVSDVSAVEELARSVLHEYGSADVICSNAGVMRPGAVWELTPEHWRQALDVNVMGAVNMAHSFIPPMLASGLDGHFVTTVGLVGLFTSPFSPPGSYTVSKHAALAFTEILLEELKFIGAPIGVSALCPAGVRTAFSVDRATADGETVRRDDVWPLVERLYNSIAGGISPRALADATVAAILEDRFWVFPHPDLLVRAKHRFDYVLAGEAPTGPY